MAKMKPCPFCGTDKPVLCKYTEGTVWWYCSNCGAIGPEAETKSAATRLWNKRSKEETDG